MMRIEDVKFNEFMDKCEMILEKINTKEAEWFDSHANVPISGEIDMSLLLDEVIDRIYDDESADIALSMDNGWISLSEMLNDPELDWRNSDEAFNELMLRIDVCDDIVA